MSVFLLGDPQEIAGIDLVQSGKETHGSFFWASFFTNDAAISVTTLSLAREVGSDSSAL